MVSPTQPRPPEPSCTSEEKGHALDENQEYSGRPRGLGALGSETVGIEFVLKYVIPPQRRMCAALGDRKEAC